MSSTPLNVLVLGATGTLGQHIARSFLTADNASKVKLSLLVRSATYETAGPKRTELDALKAKGAHLIFGDIGTDSEEQLTTAVKGQNVIISAVGGPHIVSQIKLIDAAKKAGVSWFFPSAFGADVESIGRGSAVAPLFDPKIDVSEHLRKSGLTYTIIASGVFGEYIISPLFGIDIKGGTITAPGSFDVNITATPLADIGAQVADLVLNGRGKNEIVYLGNDTFTFHQLAAYLEKFTGREFKKIAKPIAESEAAIKANPGDFASRFAVVFGTSKHTSWKVENTYAYKYKFPLQTIEQFLQSAVNKQ